MINIFFVNRIKKLFFITFPVLISFGVISAGELPGKKTSSKEILPDSVEIAIPSSLKSKTQDIAVTIYTPPGKKTRGNILVLPGWKHSRHRWLNETNLKEQADEQHFRLICPEMNLTLYESEYFPETTLKWAETPGLKWIREFLLPELKSKGIFLPDQNNFVLGLSTGARGAVLIALDNPGLFRAVGALSGDYDQTAMPKDRLMTAVYGSIEKFPERWKKDNPVQMAKKWNTPIYLAHGTNDKVVPADQTKLFYTLLRKLHVALEIQLNMPEAGHDYAFWGSETKNVLDFFNKFVKNIQRNL